MAETQVHLNAMMDAIQALRDRFGARHGVHVEGNMLLCYEEANPAGGCGRIPGVRRSF